MVLQNLPAELVEKVFDDVDTPADLAALSTVCRSWHAAICPRGRLGRLKCCHLAVTLDNRPVLSELASKPYLARTVRKFSILSQSQKKLMDVGIWHELGKPGHVVKEYDANLLNAALSQMTHLESLTAFFFEEESNDPRRLSGHISTGVFTNCGSTIERLCLCALTIEDFSVLRFPRLRNLWLDEIDCMQPSFPLFLQQHPTIEYLYCPAGFNDPPNFPSLLPHTLPNLRHLNATLDPSTLLTIVKPLPDGSYRPLERLFIASDTLVDLPAEVCEHLANITTLTDLQLDSLTMHSEDHSVSFWELCVACSHVRIVCYIPLCHAGSIDQIKECMIEHGECIGQMPQVQTIKGFFIENGHWGYDWGESVYHMALETLNQHCPNLTCVDQWVKRSPGVWEKDRELEGWDDWKLIEDRIPRQFFRRL